jgi:hypothetical protein
MKSYTVLATFPTLPASVAQQAATGAGSDMSVAVCRAIKTIMQRKGVKGRRIERFTLSVTCNGEVESQESVKE